MFRTSRILIDVSAALILLSGCEGPFESIPDERAEFERIEGAPSLAPAAIQATGDGQIDKNGGPAPAETGFYPLQIGNRWSYARRFAFQVFPDKGPPQEPSVSRSTIARELICIEQRSGHGYIVERSEETEPERTILSWVRFRQDRSGLYEADVAISEPPICVRDVSSAPPRSGLAAAGGFVRKSEEAVAAIVDPVEREAFCRALVVLEERMAMVRRALVSNASQGTAGPGTGELTRLRYPLRPGSRWTIRPDPLVIAWVEGVDTFDTPAGRQHGNRIRIHWPDDFSPEDRVRVWYGRNGYLKSAIHLEGIATDSEGNRIGRIVARETELLTGVWLQARPGLLSERLGGADVPPRLALHP